MENYSNNKTKTIAKNTIFLYIRMAFLTLISLYTSRLVLATLGVEDFGIYGIVGGIVIFFSFLNSAMSSATQRFISFSLGGGRTTYAKDIFSASLTLHIAIVAIAIILSETVGLYFLNNYLNIPSSKMYAANVVYQFSIITFSIQIMQIPYNAMIVAHEKMSFFAYIGVLEGVFKLLVAFLLLEIAEEKLVLYGGLTMVVSLIVFVIYRYYVKKNIGTTKRLFYWEASLCKELLGFSGWSLMGGVANVTANQGVNFLLNIFYGVAVNAAMGIANQVNVALNNFVANFQTAFRPQIVKLYASNCSGDLFTLINQTSRFSFYLLYVLALPLIFNMDYVLNLWLKEVPEYAVSFCQLILIYSLIESISGPLWMAIQATGRIKVYQIIISGIILLNIIVSFILLKWGYSPEDVLYVKIIINLFCLITRIVFLKRLINMDIKKYFKKAFIRIISVLLVSLCLSFFTLKISMGSLCSIALIFMVAFLSVFFVGIEYKEWISIKSYILKKI